MSERIKKHRDIVFIFGIGTLLAVIGFIGLTGFLNPVFGDVPTTVVVTAVVQEWMTFTSNATSAALTGDMVDISGGTRIASSSPIAFTLATNSSDGYSITASSSNNGLASSTYPVIQIANSTGTVAAGTNSYGIQATSSSMTIKYVYAWATSTNTVGRASTTTPIATRSATSSADIMYVVIKAAAGQYQPAATYYDVLTFTALPTP
jgi:hypothetical protein